VALAVATGLLTGALPALRAIRIPIVDVLKDGARGFTGGIHRNRTQAALVVSEIALAFVLLAGAALFIKSYTALTAVEPGFVADNVLTMSVELPEKYRDSPEEAYNFVAELHDRLGALPGVQAVGGASQMPFMGGTSWPPTSVETSDDIVDDNIHHATVTPEYFATMKIPLIAGRQLAQTDRFSAPHVAVVSEAMVRNYWPDENPIGRRIRVNVGDDPQWITIVGIVGDVKYGLNRNPYPQFYRPYAQDSGWYQNIVLKTAMAPDALTPAVRDLLRSMDPDVPTTIRRLEDRIDQSSAVARKRFQIYLLGCLSGLAALLAVVGIYGVLAYIVSQRSHEIGIRMALGAGKASVMRNVVGRGLLLAGIGLVIGFAIALAFSRLMESLLFEVSPTDPATLAGVALLVALAAVAASSLPAYRATKVDPSEALRQE
jgi:putative ABC transport system permease protein